MNEIPGLANFVCEGQPHPGPGRGTRDEKPHEEEVMTKNTILRIRKVEQKVAPAFEQLESKAAPGAIWSNIGHL
jgi:hypothetical protein